KRPVPRTGVVTMTPGLTNRSGFALNRNVSKLGESLSLTTVPSGSSCGLGASLAVGIRSLLRYGVFCHRIINSSGHTPSSFTWKPILARRQELNLRPPRPYSRMGVLLHEDGGGSFRLSYAAALSVRRGAGSRFAFQRNYGANEPLEGRDFPKQPRWREGIMGL